ncbi:hypothetical protein GCM10017687_31180 [Streptomyces echinatus]
MCPTAGSPASSPPCGCSEAGDLPAAPAALTADPSGLPEPGEFTALGEETGYRTAVTWAGADRDGGTLEVVFSAPGTAPVHRLPPAGAAPGRPGRRVHQRPGRRAGLGRAGRVGA